MNATLHTLQNAGVPIPIRMLKAVMGSGDEDKTVPHEITGDDVQPETPPTPVNPSPAAPPAKEDGPIVKPHGGDQRPNR